MLPSHRQGIRGVALEVVPSDSLSKDVELGPEQLEVGERRVHNCSVVGIHLYMLRCYFWMCWKELKQGRGSGAGAAGGGEEHPFQYKMK